MTKKILIYTFTKIWVDTEEMCEHDTQIFLTEKVAKETFDRELKQWLAEKEEHIDEDIEKWQINSLICDLESDDYTVKHYVYNNGQEKIFELKRHSV